VLAAIAGTGLDLDALVADLVIDPAAVSVLLVGSLAEGLGTTASDVDLLVLADSPADQRAGGVVLAHDGGATVEFRCFEHGMEINPELAFRSEMRPIVGAFLELAPLLYQPDAQVRFPRLTRHQIRLLHRLRTGVTWSGPERVEMWRDELYTKLLPPYLALRYVSDLDRSYEQALVLREGGAAASSPFALAVAGRNVGEAALLAGLASVGVTNPSVAAAVDLAAGVEDPDVRPLLDLALHSMFPPMEMDAEGGLGYLAQLAALRDAADARIGALGLDRTREAIAVGAPIVLPAAAR
jgi:predicted nucleotidyltransferase